MNGHLDTGPVVDLIDPWEPGMKPPCWRCGHAETEHDFSGNHNGCNPCTKVSDDGVALCDCFCYFPNMEDKYDED